jgi:hypothetical protein
MMLKMSESFENKILEIEVVIANDYPGIHEVEEYLDVEKPKYDWDSRDNLIACFKKGTHFSGKNLVEVL